MMESDPDPKTPQGDSLDILAALAQAYEAGHVLDQPLGRCGGDACCDS